MQVLKFRFEMTGCRGAVPAGGARWRLPAVVLLLCLGAFSFTEKAPAQASSLRKRSEVFSRLPLTKFYDTPAPLGPGKPGGLIRASAFDEYRLPPSVSATRILYYSRAANGELVAASGVVLFPDQKPPSGGWPLIAWAHALSGVARVCAPSLERNVGDGPLLAMYVNLGYAVVATDYTGLGTNFPNAFADAQSNAWNVIDSVAAAHDAVPGIGSRWIAMGAGEGAMAALRVAEVERADGNSNFLGSIAISRIADLVDQFAPALTPSSDSALLLAHGIKAIDPIFKPEEILTSQAMPVYQKEQEECGVPEASKVPPAAMFRPGWQSNKFVRAYFNRNRAGEARADAPLLIVSGEEGAAMVAIMKVVRRMCGQGDRLLFRRFAEGDPGSVIGDSAREQMSWIQDRFAGRAAPANCSEQ